MNLEGLKHLEVEKSNPKSQDAGSSNGLSSGGNAPASLSYSSNKDNVKVVIRMRPLSEREKGSGGVKQCVEIQNETTVVLDQRPDYKVFNFDWVGDESLAQETVFNQIAKPIADSCLEGYNGSIFAYGQTGAGKTFTIQGPAISVNGDEAADTFLRPNDPAYELRGLMPRSFEYIFESIEQAKKQAQQESTHFEYLVRCQYLEIYNESIRDLLDPSQINLHIREDIKKGVYVEGLNEEPVQSANDMMELITRGARNRHVGSTSMNMESSRSHSVLTTIIESKSMKEGGIWNLKTSRFHIIDLAGSERQKFTNTQGDRLKEAGMINKSLSALGNVINSLVDISEGKNRHVHYRDSKLTFLLRDSLGGNSKTLIIANISPSGLCFGETLSTLKFAQRAKLIRNKAVINEDSSGTILILKNEIKRLTKELAETEKRCSTLMPSNQCTLCKNNITSYNQGHVDFEEEDLLEEIKEEQDQQEAEQLPSEIKNKYLNNKKDLTKMTKRVVYLENLLSANLDNLTSQQKYYDSELLKSQQQTQRLQQAVDSYEKQRTRDKMIVKFREDRIAKLEANQPPTKEDNQKFVAELKKEMAVWKDAAEHNAQAAKLFAEKTELQNKHDQLAKEIKETPDSLSAQMRSVTEMMDGLNDYLKQYNEESKKEVECELSKTKLEYAEKIEALNVKVLQQKEKEQTNKDKHQHIEKEWKESLVYYKVEIERVKVAHQEEKDNLEKRSFEELEKIRSEIDQISENKTESEKQNQKFMIDLLEKEKDIAGLKDRLETATKSWENQRKELESAVETEKETARVKESELVKKKDTVEAKVQSMVKDFEQEKAKLIAQKKEEIEQTEKRIYEQEMQAIQERSQREQNEERAEQMLQRIQQLEEENETIQSGLNYKEAEVADLRSQIGDKEREKQDILNKIAQLQEHFKGQEEELGTQIRALLQKKSEVAQENATLTKDLEVANAELEALRSAKQEVEDEVQFLHQQHRDLEAKLKEMTEEQIRSDNAYCEQLKAKDQVLKEAVARHAEELQKMKEHLEVTKRNSDSEMEAFKEKLRTAETAVQSSESESQQKIVEMETQLKDFEVLLEQQIAQFQASLGQKESEFIEAQRATLQAHESDKEELEKVHGHALGEKETNLQNTVTTLKESQQAELSKLRTEFDLASKTHSNHASALQKEIKDLHQKISETRSEMEFKETFLNTEKQSEVENVVLDFEKKEADYELQIGELRDEVKALVQAHQEVLKGKDVTILEAEQRLQSHVQEFTQQIEELQTEYSRQQETTSLEHENLKVELRDVIKEKESIESDACDTQNTFQTEIQALKKEIEVVTRQKENSEIFGESKLKEASNTITEKQNHISVIERKLEQWQRTQTESQQMVQELQAETESQHKELEDLKYLQETLLAEKAQLKVKYAVAESMSEEHQSKLQQTQDSLKQSENELVRQRKVLDETVSEMSREHLKKFSQQEEAHLQELTKAKQEIDIHKANKAQLKDSVDKLKAKNDEQNEMLKGSKETVATMVQKENKLMSELERKISELHEHQEKQKAKMTAVRDEKDHLRKDWERLKKENDNIKELVRLKDRQIDEQLMSDQKDKEEKDKLAHEVKELRKQVTRNEHEMKEVVKTLQFYSNEKTRFENEVKRLHRENDSLVGHKNPSQKIQHHLKIKEENNKLKEDNYKLQEELRKKADQCHKMMKSLPKEAGSLSSAALLASIQSPSEASYATQQPQEANDEVKKLKKENMTIQETISRLVDHILSQPTLLKVSGITDQMPQSESGSKVKSAMEVVSMFSNVVQQKDKEVKELLREKKKVECRLDIVEKEKNLCKQQLELVQSSNNSSYIGGVPSFLQKSPSQPDYSIGHNIDTGHLRYPPSATEQMHSSRQPSNNSVSNFVFTHDKSNEVSSNGSGFNSQVHSGQGYKKSTPSPIFNVKQQKEKENCTSKRELFPQQNPRSGSYRRSAYLSNKQSQQ